MSPSMRTVGARLLLVTLPALALTVAFLEFGVFRAFVAVDSTPLATYDSANQMLKYWPNQAGLRYPDRDRHHPVAYSINRDGWNSSHPAYEVGRNAHRRIAVIGDSYVEAFQVNPAESVSARLEAELGPTETEVFSFGISGAPLSHYLYMARYVARTFSPDVLVVVIVHNDFTESYLPKPERFSPSFMHLELGDAIREEAPEPYQPLPWAAEWVLTHSATARAGFYGWRVLRESAAERAGEGRVLGRFEANVDVGLVAQEEPRIRRATRYVFDQLAALARGAGCRILLVMDSPREALYAGRTPQMLDVYRLNRIADDAAAQAGLDFIDLTDAFVEDYAREKRRFEFLTDNHWNAHAHDLVARTIAARLDGRAH